ncbi:MAG: XRE family transcriptional regulator, partial [Proteobacteria bacterium]
EVRDEEIIRSGQAIAGAMKARREAVGLSMNALSQKAGISVQSVSFIETAVNSPSLSTFLRICHALEIDPDVLLREALRNQKG